MRFILFLALMAGFLMTSNHDFSISRSRVVINGGTTNAGVIIDPNG